VSEWIHVNEALPEPMQDVIIALETMDEGLQVMMGCRMEDGTWQLTGDLDVIPITGVLWWMPAPLPPGPRLQ